MTRFIRRACWPPSLLAAKVGIYLRILIGPFDGQSNCLFLLFGYVNEFPQMDEGVVPFRTTHYNKIRNCRELLSSLDAWKVCNRWNMFTARVDSRMLIHDA